MSLKTWAREPWAVATTGQGRPRRLAQTAIGGVVTASLALAAVSALAAPGDLDPSFGDQGKVITEGAFNEYHEASDVVVDPTSGEVYIVGTGLGPNGEGPAPVVETYTGGGIGLGKWTFDLHPGPPCLEGCANATRATAGMIHPVDGSLWVAGSDEVTGFDPRIPPPPECSHPGGAPTCVSFFAAPIGLGGGPALFGRPPWPWVRVISPSETKCDPPVTSMVIEDDGDIIVGGTVCSGDPTLRDFALVRFLYPTGEVDSSFGNEGLVVMDLQEGEDRLEALALQPDGKILAAGASAKKGETLDEDYALVRFQPSGARDTSFGTNGVVIADFEDGRDTASGVAIQDDGRIVLAGTATASYTTPDGAHWFTRQVGLVRYEADGALDGSFGSGGRVLFTYTCLDGNTCFGERAFDVTIDAEGRILVVGDAAPDPAGPLRGIPRFALTRFACNGDPDSGFGMGGRVATMMGDYESTASSVTIQGDGKIVAAGTTNAEIAYLAHQFAGARYLDGSPAGDCEPEEEDTAAPVCGLVSRTPSAMTVRVQDTASGLVSIDVTAVNNIASITPGDQAYSPPNTSPVEETATKADPSQRARWTLQATDAAGNTTVCTSFGFFQF